MRPRRAKRAAEELAGDDPPLLVDVRFPGEVENMHIEASLAIPLGDMCARLDELPRDRRLLLQCKTGYRSMTAGCLLVRAGFDPARVVDLAGGIDAWTEAGLPVVGSGCPA